MSDMSDHPEEVSDVEEDEAPADLMSALKEVMKRARVNGGLVSGIHGGCKALEKGGSHLCILAEDCAEDAYTRLVTALCSAHNVDLIKVAERKKIGEWAGLAKYNCEGELIRVVGASVAVITDYGEPSKALVMLQEHFKK